MALSPGETDPAERRKPWLALPLSGWCLGTLRCAAVSHAVGSEPNDWGSWAGWVDAALLLLRSVGGIISAASLSWPFSPRF